VNLRNAFDALDWLGRGFLTSNEFKRQFERISQRMSTASIHNSIVLKNDSVELEGMIRRFNKDKLNGRFSLPEFLEELQPKNPGKAY
jgi:Ca2+-binding EF-hand superfamily protein